MVDATHHLLPFETDSIERHGCLPHNLGSLLHEAGVDEFRALSELKAKGWKDKRMDDHFQEQRDAADRASDKLSRLWFLKMRNIFEEIEVKSECIQRTGKMSFLDLGCCPGGFTSYILEQNAKAKGFGISLEVEKGGHKYLLGRPHRARFKLLFADLTYFQLGPKVINDPRLKPLPPQIKSRSRGLVVLDGHLLRTQEDVRRFDYDRLMVSQLVMGLLGVKIGGTIVIKLSKPDAVRTAKVLYMLDAISDSLLTCKPRTMHGSRATFYAIAKGVGLGTDAKRLPAIVEGLQELWFEVTFGGDEGCGLFLNEADLDFIVSTDELVGNYLDRLIELGREVWMVQASCLRGLLRKKGINVDDVILPSSII